MPVPAAILKMLFASTFFSPTFLTSGKRLKQQKMAQLMEVQATRGSPPLVPRTSDTSGGGLPRSITPAWSDDRLAGESNSSGWRQGYGLPGIGRAMASADAATMAAVAEDALNKQRRYGGLWQTGDASNAAMPSGRDVPKRASPGKRGHGAVPSSKELKEVFGSIDADHDRKLNLQELQHGMKEVGSPMPDDELEKLVNLVDSNRDSTVDADEFVAAVEATAGMSSARAGEHPLEIVMRRKIFREAFEQEVVKMIDSLIARDIHKDKTRFPKWAALVQKLQHEGIEGDAANDVLMALYKQCGTHETAPSGVHEKCILDKLQALIGQEGEQTLADGMTVLQMFVESIRAQLKHLIQVYLKTLKEEV